MDINTYHFTSFCSDLRLSVSNVPTVLTDYFFSSAEREAQRICNKFCTDSPNSITNDINHFATKHPIPIDVESMEILKQCFKYKSYSHSYFDICMGSDKSQEGVLINQDNNTIFLTSPEIQLDLRPYIKAYVIHQILKLAQLQDIQNCILQLGNYFWGAIGTDGKNNAWTIDIMHAYNPEYRVHSLSLKNQYLCLSGIYPQHTKHHIIDPVRESTVKQDQTIGILSSSPYESAVLSLGHTAAGQHSNAFVRNFKIFTGFRINYDGKEFLALNDL